MTKVNLEKIKKIFASFDEVKLAYLFGSRSRGDFGPMSDYDFAVYLDTKDKKRIFAVKAALMDEISRSLHSDKIDLVVLNTAEKSELKYQIVTEGKLIFEREPFKLYVEPRIMNEYFDFLYLLRRYGLTKA